TQSSGRCTSTPSSSVSFAPTGSSENLPLSFPTFGRPRCEASTTFAPDSIAFLIVGSASRTRVSSATFRSSVSGQLKSTRMKTRRRLLERVVHRVFARALVDLRDERDDGNVRRRHADREAVQLSFELRQHETDRLRRPRRRRDHGERRRTRAPWILVLEIEDAL